VLSLQPNLTVSCQPRRLGCKFAQLNRFHFAPWLLLLLLLLLHLDLSGRKHTFSFAHNRLCGSRVEVVCEHATANGGHRAYKCTHLAPPSPGPPEHAGLPLGRIKRARTKPVRQLRTVYVLLALAGAHNPTSCAPLSHSLAHSHQLRPAPLCVPSALLRYTSMGRGSARQEFLARGEGSSQCFCCGFCSRSFSSFLIVVEQVAPPNHCCIALGVPLSLSLSLSVSLCLCGRTSARVLLHLRNLLHARNNTNIPVLREEKASPSERTSKQASE